MPIRRSKSFLTPNWAFRAARPGSVLFIVIALLLLLAVISIAYLKSSSSARIASAQFTGDTTISMQLDGISEAVKGIIADDLNDDWGNLRGDIRGTSQTFRQNYRGAYASTSDYNIGDVVSYALPSPYPAGPSHFFVCIANLTQSQNGSTPVAPAFFPNSGFWRPTTHVPVTSPLIQPWLADRIPALDAKQQTPIWPNISQTAAQPNASTPDGTTATLYPTSVLGLPFESPAGDVPPFSMVPPGGTYANLEPTYAKTPTGNVPAFYFNGNPVIAGDADGDGIADCLLSRVPGMSAGGLTWYVGIRIIDNNSAINVNTACSRDNEIPFGTGSAPANYYGLFQTGIGLKELIAEAGTHDDFNTLLNYRLNAAAPTTQPYSDTGVASSPRSDFSFITQTDELYHQLVRRLANPGRVSATSLAQSLSWSDSAAIASRFCLVNPNTIQSGNPSSLLETLLPLSTFRGAQNGNAYFNSTPYGTHGTDADVSQWYLDNFDFDGTPVAKANGATNAYGGAFPLRPFLTARNPVSNYVTPVYDVSQPSTIGNPISQNSMLPWGGTSSYSNFRGLWSQTATYQQNDIVLGTDGYTYIWISPTSGNSPKNVPPNLANLVSTKSAIYSQWQLQPWNPNPNKANINTATFRELFRNFCCVMMGNTSSGQNISPYPLAPVPQNIYKTDPKDNPECMFRSPLRDCTSNVGSPSVSQLDPVVTVQGTNYISGVNTMQLRAALAAVNAMGLRSGSQNVISRTIVLQGAMISSAPTQKPVPQMVQVRVYSSEPQPLISEVYANTYAGDDGNVNDPNSDGLANLKGYVAIELYNPYAVPLTLNNWQAGYIPRTAATYPSLGFNAVNTIQSIGPLIPMNPNSPPGTPPANPLSVVIPPHGYALLENFNAGFVQPPSNVQLQNVNDAHYRPASMFQTDSFQSRQGIWSGPPQPTPNNPTVVDVYVPGLSNVMTDLPGTPNGSPGGEFVLLRPRRADGIFTQSGSAILPPTTANPLTEYYNEGSTLNPNLADLVPVDSFDFTGLQQTGPGASTYNVWSYIRPKGMPPSGTPGSNFRTTYPGRYDAGGSAPREKWTDIEQNLPTGVGIETISWQNAGAQPVFGNFSNGLPGAKGLSFPPIQIFNLGYDSSNKQSNHFPNSAISQPGNTPAPQQQFPFGTFARNGDMLEIPYIGSYRITLASQLNGNTPGNETFLELNSLPMDSAMAVVGESDATIAPYENIGRFIPLSNNPAFDKTNPDYFSWTKKLFDYFTVQSTNDNYFPNFDPALCDVTTPPAANASIGSNPGVVYPPAPPNVSQTFNKDAAAGTELNQDDVGVDGLININTASYQILSQLPMVSGSNFLLNQSLAKAIVAWRQTHGPFASIYDLNQVEDLVAGGANSTMGFQNEDGKLPHLFNLSSQQGILTPPDPAFPNVSSTPVTTNIAQEEFQADNLALTRISNMITTRSDTFTVYIVLQGWANAGTSNAQPMLTRRFAFIADRSGINADPRSRSVKTIAVPTN